MTATTRDDLLIDLRARLVNVRAQISDGKLAEADLLAQIRDAIGDEVGTIKANGSAVFDVSYSRRFDPALAETVLRDMPPSTLDACRVTVIDSAKCRAVLSPVIYAMCQAVSTTPTIKAKS